MDIAYNSQSGVLVNYRCGQWNYVVYKRKYTKQFLGLLSQYNDNEWKYGDFEVEEHFNFSIESTTLDGAVSCLTLRNEVVA